MTAAESDEAKREARRLGAADVLAKPLEPRAFNLMFITYVGAIQDEDSKSYLRPETAQGIFLNYKNVVDTTRVKLPFGRLAA